MATTSTLFTQDQFLNFHYSRRILVAATPQLAPSPAAGNSHDPTDLLLVNDIPIDTNVVLVLSVILCGLICSLFLNSIIKCAFKYSSLMLTDSSSNHRSTSTEKLANKGIKKKTLKTFPVITYTTGLEHPGIDDSECVICLSEFGVGEKIKVLPKCNHCFHVNCIDKWLNSHSSCPTCRHCLIETCQKSVNGDSSVTTTAIPNSQVANNISSSAATVQEIIIRIEPLQREDVVSSN
ncbi:RING-H2 finger protein ATL78-like [Nicotiana tabacum]|uniref:RING-type E3 ubiquitin transferase n=1 Tax=Nicotiana tabacum TaxID=4097 RepID=A0A1S4B4Z7_TOBAC|nr:PREDICTED: RING-H2 finger protein ATL78-like [Nicotiana tabacum]